MNDLEKLPFIMKNIITKNIFLAIRQKINTNEWVLLQILNGMVWIIVWPIFIITPIKGALKS